MKLYSSNEHQLIICGPSGIINTKFTIKNLSHFLVLQSYKALSVLSLFFLKNICDLEVQGLRQEQTAAKLKTISMLTPVDIFSGLELQQSKPWAFGPISESQTCVILPISQITGVYRGDIPYKTLSSINQPFL